MSHPKLPFESVLTFDDVLLVPQHSQVLPKDVCLHSRFSRNITLKIPLVSSAMDTVTESRTAIVMAQQGGIGVIHKNMLPKNQAKEVTKVKRYVAGMIIDPICLKVADTLEDVFRLRKKFKITGMPVIDENDELVGILTNRDTQFVSDPALKVESLMTGKDRIVTAHEGIELDEAKDILQKNRIEKLPIIDSSRKLKGLITSTDIKKSQHYPNATVDEYGSLRVAAAIGVGDKEKERAKLLVEAGVDALIVDTAHGHSAGVESMVKFLKKQYKVDVIAGNIASGEAAEFLIKAGADGVKVGVGPGSICTTRIIAGVGVPQLSAILDCYEVCKKHNIPYIADGGIKYSGDVVKALGAGASTVMVGSLFAGTDEAPGEKVLYQGRVFKLYRGMGSLGAMTLGSKDRYGQGDIKDKGKLVPEGIEGQVPYRGSLSTNVYQLLGGLRSGMGYLGAKNLETLVERAVFKRITQASLKESHPHDVTMTKDAPNYRSNE